MNRVIALIFFLSSFNSYAECDFSKDVIKNENGSYTYSRDCHIEVGKLVKTVDLQKEQIILLEKTIEVKDLAISKANERTQLWMDTSYTLEEKFRKLDSINKWDNTLHFGLGIGVTILAVWAAGQLK